MPRAIIPRSKPRWARLQPFVSEKSYRPGVIACAATPLGGISEKDTPGHVIPFGVMSCENSFGLQTMAFVVPLNLLVQESAEMGAITENLIGAPAVHVLAPSGGRTSSINRSFARLNGLTNLTLCKMNPSCRSSVSRHCTPARCAEAQSIASQNDNR
jgi:hypothetical protein